MKTSVKICAVILMAVLLITTVCTSVFASDYKNLINAVSEGENQAVVDSSSIASKAGTIMKLIRTIAVIAGTVIIAILGIKYMMGSVQEKSEYKKSFIPLIVGILVVMAATSIATLLFSL